MVPDSLWQTIAGTGVVGVFLIITLAALRQRDKELQDEKEARRQDAERHRAEIAAEKNARIEDSRLAGQTALAMQREAIVAVSVLAKATERAEEEEERRSRLEHELSLRQQTPAGSFPVQQPPKRVPR